MFIIYLNNSDIYVYFNTHTIFLTPDLTQTDANGSPDGILPEIRTPDHLPDTYGYQIKPKV